MNRGISALRIDTVTECLRVHFKRRVSLIQTYRKSLHAVGARNSAHVRPEAGLHVRRDGGNRPWRDLHCLFMLTRHWIVRVAKPPELSAYRAIFSRAFAALNPSLCFDKLAAYRLIFSLYFLY